MRPPEQYGDDVLYGPRREAIRLIELAKLGNNSECVIYTIKTFIDLKQQWSMKNLIGADKRIKTMLDALKISHPLPLQCYIWPQMNKALFPFVCISPPSTGKTFAHLLYIVTRAITETSLAKTEELLTGCTELSLTNRLIPATIVASATSRNDTSAKPPKPAMKTLKLPANFDHDAFDYDSIGKSPESAIESKQVGDKQENHYDVDPNNYIMHPHYIIICSSQQQVEILGQEIERMKEAAYGHRASLHRCKNLPPLVRTIHVRQEEDKLAFKCSESNILVGTPAALNRCFTLEYLNFSRCEKVLFDDLDLTLQLHNSSVRELIKHYLIQTQPITSDREEKDQKLDKKPNGTDTTLKKSQETNCQMFVFSTKWTNLIKQFVSTIFIQRTLIFGSIVEAALYANLRYEVEICKDKELKLSKLLNLVYLYLNGQSQGEKLVIVSTSNESAKEVSLSLQKLSAESVRLVSEDTPRQSLEHCRSVGNVKNGLAMSVYVMCDDAVEHTVECLNEFTHLVHYELPEDLLVYDQRYRLMYRHIKDTGKSINTTIFLSSKLSSKYAKELEDQVSRSSTTLKGTRLTLRDFISESASSLCWRWASTGLCRLEKLSREDRFGSYCPYRHSITTDSTGASKSMARWPTSGQVKFTITHLVSPNEFYFWFEAHRDKNSANESWTKFESTGSEFMRKIQMKLDELKETESCSVPLNKFKKGKIYGIYLQQEARVDRIMLLEQPNVDVNLNSKSDNLLSRLSRIQHSLEYSKQCEVFRVDYGVKFSVYLRNIFELPAELSSLEPQCYRGFYLGWKPTDNEPDWTYKTRKHFYDYVCVNNLHSITGWLRLNSNRCFWFEHMIVSRKLPNIECNRLYKSEPHEELLQAGLAERVLTEPSCLNPSDRLETLSKWHVSSSEQFAQYAFLRCDKSPLDIYVLHAYASFELKVRQVEFNEQLIKLEDRMREDYYHNKLAPLSYFAVGVYCVARIVARYDEKTKEPIYTINRCIIRAVIAESSSNAAPVAVAVNQDLTGRQGVRKSDNNNLECEYSIECLDHGDWFRVRKRDLFLASPDYLYQLPFQAIRCKLADFNAALREDKTLCCQIQELIYDLTRTKNDDLVKLKCRLSGESGSIYVYIPISAGGEDSGELYEPLIGLVERRKQIEICVNTNTELRKSVRFKNSESYVDPIREHGVNLLIRHILRTIVTEELSARGICVDKDYGEDTNSNEDDETSYYD